MENEQGLGYSVRRRFFASSVQFMESMCDLFTGGEFSSERKKGRECEQNALKSEIHTEFDISSPLQSLDVVYDKRVKTITTKTINVHSTKGYMPRS